MAYRVTAGGVTAETNVGPGRARVDFARGAILPADVPAEDLQRLLQVGHVEEVDPDGAGVDEDGDGVPEGSARQVLEWVDAADGEDRLERARLAREAELVKGDVGRKGLLADLGKILEA